MAAACAAVLDDDEPEPLRPQKTCYEVNGVTLSVEGYTYRQDPRGGNLSAHGKATGEAFWPASRLLMDYLVRDCELLKGGAPRRVVELGCGLGLAGLVAATMLGTTKGSEVVLTDGDAGVVARARASANNARGKTAPVSCVEHRWGEPHDLGRFDVVLAAEVLYDPNVALESSNALAKSCESLLADGGVVLVAFERRGVDLQVLVDAFAAFGFDGAPAPCTDGAYEDIFEERQDEPSMLWHRCLMSFTRRPPFVDLTDCVSDEDLAAVSEELGALGVFGSELGEDIDVSVFAAESQKYGDALELADRDTSCWCADAFVSRGPADDFKLCRAHRGDPRTWRPNANATALPAVSAFARRLPCFAGRVGKIAVILNGRNDAGVEHADHALQDLVSEFVWVRPPRSTKRFYVVDAGGSRREVPPSTSVLWFDDRLKHGIFPVDDEGQVSIRIDGRFCAAFRERIRRDGTFAFDDGPAVLAAQVNGPPFLRQRAAATASFAAGDAVEACFGSGSVWYPATVLETLDREGMPMVMVRYDEDDEEEELEPCFVRKIT